MSAVAAASTAALAACGAPAAGPLLKAAGPTYVLDGNASRADFPLSSFADATPVDPTLMTSTLKRDHAANAAGKVWRMPDGEFVLDLAARFKDSYDADSFEDFMLAQLADRASRLEPTSPSSSDGVFTDIAIPGAHAYVTGGTDRAGTGSIFVEGVLFATGDQLFLVETGGPSPTTLATAEALAKTQYQDVTAEGSL